MTHIDRRDFLRFSGHAVAGLAGLSALASRAYAGPRRLIARLGDGGYGPLVEAGKELALPEGFSYKVIGMQGSTMSDGYRTPGRHDGMAAFPMPNGNIRLIRNHEVENQPSLEALVGDQSTAWDPGAGGGTVSLEIDPETREIVRHFVSLNGTWRNCSGGRTPWGSWLSCEEGFFGPESGFGDYHGYVFDVPASREAAEFTEPLVAMGRFVHEAVAVDPRTGIVYETEDHYRAGFYRFIPNEPYRGPDDAGDLRAGGALQMLGISDKPGYDTSKRQRVGDTLPVRWVDIPEVNPLGGPDDFDVVFKQGREQGGARFSRLEGCFYHGGTIYMVATDGGDKEMGQIWGYRPDGMRGGALTLVFESPHKNVLKRPDNVCVSPRGTLVVCEDANERQQFVRGITSDGKVFDIVGNLTNKAELAGVTFSPDGQTMFCNQLGKEKRTGMSFAVWGPWERGSV